MRPSIQENTMPRALKTDKFYIYAAEKKGHLKGKRLMGINNNEELTIQDLLDFLAEKGVSPSHVKLPSSFVTYVRES